MSALTHGNPTGYLSAGVLSYIVSEVLNGKELEDIIKDSIEMIKEYEGHEELHDKLSLVLDLNADDKDIAEAVDILEEGVDAHGVLSTALYALLSDADSKDTLKIAANHSGESSAVAAICGGIIGLDSGLDEFPEEWVENLELSDFIVEMSDKLYNAK